jgi:PGF-CTERM protein
MKTKSKKIALVVLTAILAISTFSVILTPVGAQPVEVWNVTWGGPANEEGTAIATSEDSVYLAGSRIFSNENMDVFLNKYDNDGNLLWNVTWGGAGFYSASTITTAGGSVYMAGSVYSNVTGTGLEVLFNVTEKAFLNKYDSDGNLLWNITWGDTSLINEGSAMAAAGDYVYLAGNTMPPLYSNATSSNFLNKYDSDGNLAWSLTWGGMGYSAEAAATSGDSVYVAGTAPGIPGKAFLNKYDRELNPIWNITGRGFTEGKAIATAGDNVYLAGSAPGRKAFLDKYNSAGNPIWNITWGTWGEEGRATATSGDSVYLAGTKVLGGLNFRYAYLNKYDSAGNPIWNITRGTGWDFGNAIATSGDSVYLAGSGVYSVANKSDALLVKFSESTPTLTPTPIPTVTPTPPTPTPTPAVTPTPSPTPPGFEAGFAIAGVLAVAYLVLRRRN